MSASAMGQSSAGRMGARRAERTDRGSVDGGRGGVYAHTGLGAVGAEVNGAARVVANRHGRHVVAAAARHGARTTQSLPH